MVRVCLRNVGSDRRQVPLASPLLVVVGLIWQRRRVTLQDGMASDRFLVVLWHCCGCCGLLSAAVGGVEQTSVSLGGSPTIRAKQFFRRLCLVRRRWVIKWSSCRGAGVVVVSIGGSSGSGVASVA